VVNGAEYMSLLACWVEGRLLRPSSGIGDRREQEMIMTGLRRLMCVAEACRRVHWGVLSPLSPHRALMCLETLAGLPPSLVLRPVLLSVPSGTCDCSSVGHLMCQSRYKK
jgi:hypothetical protein